MNTTRSFKKDPWFIGRALRSPRENMIMSYHENRDVQTRKLDARLPHFRVAPGGYIATGSEVVITTLLGSCVAVCLYDPVNKVAGMNHIMNSSGKNRVSKIDCDQTEAGLGFCAMDLLVREMMTKGARLENMIAKVFGGASLFGPHDSCEISIDYCFGDENVRFAIDYLKQHSIPVISQAVGGDAGRIIILYTSDFSVWVKQINKRSNPVLIRKDNNAWDALNRKTGT